MAKGKSDSLFKLIKSLKKSEKRYFKLFVTQIESGKGKKFIRLFDLIDKQSDFDEDKIIAKDSIIKADQLSNLKAHLYKRILQSLRQYNVTKVLDIETRELIDYSEILFNRCLYDQCLKVLQKAKKRARKNDNLELLLEIYKWEKLVINNTVGPDNQNRANKIVAEVQDANNRINNINTFTNLAVKLNSFYLKLGFIRNKKDYDKIKNFFNASLPYYEEDQLSFNEKLHLYDLMVSYCFFIQDFEKGYGYAKKWVGLFEGSKDLISARLEMYIKGLNSLLIAQHKLWRYNEFVESHRTLRNIKNIPGIELNENIQLKLFKYNYVHEFNRYFMLGEFAQGVARFNKFKTNLEVYINRLDEHSKLIMFYKIACLYFGNADHRMVISWLNKIINTSDIDLREDIHCFARIVNLVSHYELGNTDVIEYYIKSTYRFLLKKDDLHLYQKYILNFLKRLNKEMTEEKLLEQFKNLRDQLLPLTSNRFEKRPFIYFDIISWLESKIQKRPIQEIVREKANVVIFGKNAA
ncbi:hypothetical protein [Flexithrix dorotheae]|uniref:hypothetical protein n=1 Tax=Flexithrix dorotheae TaxID=70993 RepID=UPI00037CD744|nr:hypothetical protein [Flexithrix dorotheae]